MESNKPAQNLAPNLSLPTRVIVAAKQLASLILRDDSYSVADKPNPAALDYRNE